MLVFMKLHMYVCTYGGQRTAVGSVPQVLYAFVFIKKIFECGQMHHGMCISEVRGQLCGVKYLLLTLGRSWKANSSLIRFVQQASPFLEPSCWSHQFLRQGFLLPATHQVGYTGCPVSSWDLPVFIFLVWGLGTYDHLVFFLVIRVLEDWMHVLMFSRCFTHCVMGSRLVA